MQYFGTVCIHQCFFQGLFTDVNFRLIPSHNSADGFQFWFGMMKRVKGKVIEINRSICQQLFWICFALIDGSLFFWWFHVEIRGNEPMPGVEAGDSDPDGNCSEALRIRKPEILGWFCVYGRILKQRMLELPWPKLDLTELNGNVKAQLTIWYHNFLSAF